MRVLHFLFAFPLLAGCGWLSVYRMEIQQGNYVSQEAASQLKLGMTKDQVRFALGTPLLADIFHEDRWDYVYRRERAGSRQVEERKFSVFFKDGKLVQIEGDVVPSDRVIPSGGAGVSGAPGGANVSGASK